jgi:hypothetical protein
VTFSSLLPSSLVRRGLIPLIAACLLICPANVQAQDEERHQLEEKTSTELEKLKPLIDAKNWDGAVALLNGIKSKVGP